MPIAINIHRACFRIVAEVLMDNVASIVINCSKHDDQEITLYYDRGDEQYLEIRKVMEKTSDYFLMTGAKGRTRDHREADEFITEWSKNRKAPS